MSHPMHIHNHRFQVRKDGGKIPKPPATTGRHQHPARRSAHVEFEADADPGISTDQSFKREVPVNGTAYSVRDHWCRYRRRSTPTSSNSDGLAGYEA